MLNIFEYSDYRNYLRDFYRTEKEKNKSYSFRVFANRAQLSSPNYLKLVMDGNRRITDKNLPNFVRGLRLGKKQEDYFRVLVFYQESKDVEAKQRYLEQLVEIRNRNLVRDETAQLTLDRVEILRNWWHWAIREMINLKDFRDDPKWIARRLGGRVTPKQVQESMELLQRLEFIRKTETGYEQSEPLLTTGDDFSPLLLMQLHQQFIDLGKAALANHKHTEREISSLTIALPKSRIPELKEKMRKFRHELNLEYSNNETNEDVYHLSLFLYSLTDGEGGTP